MEVYFVHSYEEAIAHLSYIKQGALVVRDWNTKRFNIRILKGGKILEITRRMVILKDENPITIESNDDTLLFTRVVTQITDQYNVTRKYEGVYLARTVTSNELSRFIRSLASV